VERLMAFDELGRSYSYAILQALFPVTNYLATIRVTEANGGKGSHVEWSGQFTPKGVSNEAASKLFQGIWWLDHLNASILTCSVLSLSVGSTKRGQGPTSTHNNLGLLQGPNLSPEL